MNIGYARVSDDDQHLDLQLLALKKHGCKKIFTEKISGRSKHLPVLEKVLTELKSGDTLVIWHVDRLGRKARELLNLEYELSMREISMVSITERLDTKTPDGIYQFQMACVNAQHESSRIGMRTKAGMEAARLKGVKLGRPKRFKGKQKERVRFLAIEKDMSIHSIASRFHCAPSTVRRELQI